MASKVSVAIPTYNRIGYLKECISSIQNQTFQDFEIFVFDNSSSEPVEEELKKYEDGRIHFIGNKENVGSAGNINRILEYPFKSEYVIIFHDDDTMHPKMLQIEVAFLEARPELSFVVSDLHRVSNEHMQAFPSLEEGDVPYTIYSEKHDFLREQMHWLRYGFSTALYRKEALRGIHMQFDRFSDFADMALLAGISEKGPCAFLPLPLMNYRIHEGQDSEAYKEAYIKGAEALLTFYKERLLSKGRREDQKLFHTYAINFLLRSCAHMNKGVIGSIAYIKAWHRQKLIRYRDFMLINQKGIASLISITFHNKKVIDLARWIENLLRS